MNSKNDFVDGFLAGQQGLECPSDASEAFKDAYGRGYETSERESALAEALEKELMQ